MTQATGNVLNDVAAPDPVDTRMKNLINSYNKCIESATEEKALQEKGHQVFYPSECFDFFGSDRKHVEELVESIEKSTMEEYENKLDTGDIEWVGEVTGIVVSKHNATRYNGRPSSYPKTHLWVAFKRPLSTGQGGQIVGGDVTVAKFTRLGLRRKGPDSEMMNIALGQAVTIHFKPEQRQKAGQGEDRIVTKIEVLDQKASESVKAKAQEQKAHGKK